VMKRSPVLSAYREAGLIDTFPLHDDELLRRCYAGCDRLDSETLFCILQKRPSLLRAGFATSGTEFCFKNRARGGGSV
jgi:hypothetical protein